MSEPARKLREADLSPVVSEWLRCNGYAVYSEVPARSGLIDHVGVRWDTLEIVCVEMKTSATRKVFHQACLHQLATPNVYVAVPGRPRKSSLELARHYGVGVLSGGEVLVSPALGESNPAWVETHQDYTDSILSRCQIMQEGGTGGLPTLKGDGPAIRCAKAIVEYRKQRPKASWRELFASVPNHYAHHRSMQGAMRSYLYEIEMATDPKPENERGE